MDLVIQHETERQPQTDLIHMIPLQIYAYYYSYHCHFHSITVVYSTPSHKLDLHHTELIPKHSQSMNEMRKNQESYRQTSTKKHEESIDHSDQAAGG